MTARSDFRALGRHVAELQDRAVEDEAANEALRQRLAERAGARVRAPGPSRAPWLLAALASLGVAAAVAVIGERGAPEAAPLSFTIGEPGRAGELRAWVSAPPESGLPIRFSDGSKVTLEPNARARVVATTPGGAEVVVESGAATADVVPRAKGKWLLRSGPFVVHVTGTRFAASWDAPSDTLTVRLFEGSVLVTGCSLGAGQRLGQGQALEASCAAGRVTISPLAAFEAARGSASSKGDLRPAPVSALPSATEASVPVQPSRDGAGARARVRDAATAPTWVELARQARYEEAYRAAVAGGFSQEVQRASAPDLLLLGDSARLRGSAAHAREAYGAVRRRFAATSVAARAAFHLGQMDSLSGQHASSITWYRAYLDEMPSGGLAGAALGRIMEARMELGDVSGAQRVAAEYLERYPGGAHADDARELLGERRHD